MPLVWCLPDRPLGGMTAPAAQGMSILSWHLLPGPVKGEQGVWNSSVNFGSMESKEEPLQ